MKIGDALQGYSATVAVMCFPEYSVARGRSRICFKEEGELGVPRRVGGKASMKMGGWERSFSDFAYLIVSVDHDLYIIYNSLDRRKGWQPPAFVA